MNSMTVFLLQILTFGLAINLCAVIFGLRDPISIINVAFLVMSVGWMGFVFGAESKREFLFKFGNACFERGAASMKETS